MNLLVDGSLPLINQCFPSPFIVERFNSKEDLLSQYQGQPFILCRSTITFDKDCLQHLKGLKAILTASSGYNHIDTTLLAEKNIRLFHAEGANANSVADYVQASFAYLIHNKWLKGKKVLIVGMGHVGQKVYQRLTSLGFDVTGYDPYLLDHQGNLEELVAVSDIICLHAKLHQEPPYPSFHLIDHKMLSYVKKDAVLLNAARGSLVNEQDLLNHPVHYCADVFEHEPEISHDIVQLSLLSTPHIAGHSIEAKLNIMRLLSQKLHQFCKLPIPKEAENINIQSYKPNLNTWVEDTLKVYDPSIESDLLKQSNNIKETFLSLRKAHDYRHEFL